MKKTSKRAIMLIMTAMMGLTACRAGNSPEPEPAETTELTTVTEETAPHAHVGEIRDLPSMELVKEMKIGWNLGNTFDATIGSPKGDETPRNWETAWGNPATTKIMIDRVAAEGFNVFRLPVTWEGKFGDAPDYKINGDWLARVQEVADWALDNDMYVIINMHHEEWNMPDKDHADSAEEITRALWGQIAEHFADYDEHLIFEAMNEPRLKGTPMEWTGGNEEARSIINRWNKAFVETIRSSGGNNAKRHLMIPGYAASSSENVLKSIEVPDDDKVIVSVHAYLPYTFALAEPENATDEWSADNPADTRDIEILMLTLKDLFLDKGHAVIIGEFGMRNRFNTDARAACAGYYVSKAHEYGIPCVWWDNNAFVNGEAFGLFDRTTFEWRYPGIMSAMMGVFEDE